MLITQTGTKLFSLVRGRIVRKKDGFLLGGLDRIVNQGEGITVRGDVSRWICFIIYYAPPALQPERPRSHPKLLLQTPWNTVSRGSWCPLYFSQTHPGGLEMNVSFVSFPLVSAENNVFHHTGNPDLSAFTCDVSEAFPANVVDCNITDVTTTNIKGEMGSGSNASQGLKNTK